MAGTRWNYDCAIIGGGPGGLVSALYLRRFQRRVILINSGKPRAAWIPRTHNLIGYEDGISGRELLARLQRQVGRLGMEWARADARVHPLPGGGFEIAAGSLGKIRARTAILATGIEDVQPKIDSLKLKELREKGLLRYCSICDGYEYRREPIAVLAEDDAGLQKALFIANWTRDIRVIVPENFTPAPQRVRELREIRAKLSTCKTLDLKASRSPKGLWIRLNERRTVFCRAAYIELGCRVRDSAFAHIKKLRRTKEGFIITTFEQRTTVPGLFAVGDCVNLLGQISVAAGQAAVAATTIHNDLFEFRAEKGIRTSSSS